MADPRTLEALLERIDQDVYRHEQLQQWDVPPLDGPIYEAQAERARLAAALAAGSTRAVVAQARVAFDDAPRTFTSVEDFIANRQPGDVYRLPTIHAQPEAEQPPRRSWWERFARWPHG